MLGALQSLYADTSVRMKVQGRTGVSLPSETGLKQGCPLSPTLFGLYVDGLFNYLDTHCPDEGVVLGNGVRIRIMGYADDFVLVSILCWSVTPRRVCNVSLIVFISGVP
jgi:hypothetical protein